MNVLARLTARLPRPLDPVRSIKLKLGLLVCVSGAIGLSYFWLIIGRIPPGTSIIAIGLALLSTYVLAHGMTRPLREMTAAARAMARGDYSQRVPGPPPGTRSASWRTRSTRCRPTWPPPTSTAAS